MFYWQYIDLDPTEVKRIQEDYLKHLPNNSQFFQKVNIENRTFMGMEIYLPVLIQMKARDVDGIIHTDLRQEHGIEMTIGDQLEGSHLTIGDQLAVQIPLINCEHSLTELWSSAYQPHVEYTANGQGYRYYERSSCTKVSEFALTQPVIWRTDIPHCVSNYSDSPRLAISLRFKKYPRKLISDAKLRQSLGVTKLGA
jgi:hypothetical protein